MSADRGRVRRVRPRGLVKGSRGRGAGGRDVRNLLDSGLFVPWYYAAQSGEAAEAEQAAAHFLEVGIGLGLLANPILDFAATGLPAEQLRADLLDGSAASYPVRDLFDDLEYVALAPRSRDHVGGPVGHFLEAAERGEAVPRVAGRPWKDFVGLRTHQGRSRRLIASSGVFDRQHYERLSGRSFASVDAAIWDYLEVGEAAGLTPHPLFEPAWYRRQTKDRTSGALVGFLRSGQSAAAGPHFDAPAYLLAHPEATKHPGGALGHFTETAEGQTLTVACGGVEAAPLEQVLAAVDQAATTIGRHRAVLTGPSRRFARWYVEQGTVDVGATGGSVCIITDSRRWGRARESALRPVLDQSHQDWRLAVAVDRGTTPQGALARLAAADPRITVVETDADTPASRAASILAGAQEDWVTFWNPGQRWSPDLLSALLSSSSRHDAVSSEVVLEPLDDEGDEQWLGPFDCGSEASWRAPRSLAGVLVRRHVLEEGGLRPEAGSAFEWDFALRARLRAHYLPFVGVRVQGPEPEGPTLGVKDTDHHLVRSMHLLDWDQLGEARRVPGRASLLIPTYQDWRMTATAVRSALGGATGEIEPEAVVVDNGSTRQVGTLLAGLFAADSRVHIVPVPVNTNFATGSNLAFAHSTGAISVFLNNDTEPRPGWLDPLVGSLEEAEVLGAQSLLVYPDDSIQTAGTVFYGHGAIASHFLASFPQEDLPPPEQLRFSAVTAACFAVKSDLVVETRGFDPRYENGMEDVDLCLRMAELRQGHFVTSRDSVVVHHESKSPSRFRRAESNRVRFLHAWGDRLPGPEYGPWERAGFEVTGLRVGIPGKVSRRRMSATPVLRRPPRLVSDGPAAGLPSLRWALKISAPGGPRGDVWGDVAFARDLARGLRHYGQEVVVDRRHAHQRPGSDHLDDVALSIRGLEPATPQPGITNVLWVISHPDDVPRTELLDSFDLLYAAGATWATETSTALGRSVRTLLQATDPERFSPHGPSIEGLGTVFVGSTRKVFRPIVRDSIDVGADLTIYGPGWEEYVDSSYVRAHHLPNDELPSAYRGARIVLNDHWEDMARNGFLSNRLFDAAVAGARVVSDPAPGLEEVFGASVQVYRDLDELADLLRPDSDRWADLDEIRANAARIGSAHSFRERARVLLADVLEVRGVDHELR